MPFSAISSHQPNPLYPTPLRRRRGIYIRQIRRKSRLFLSWKEFVYISSCKETVQYLDLMGLCTPIKELFLRLQHVLKESSYKLYLLLDSTPKSFLFLFLLILFWLSIFFFSYLFLFPSLLHLHPVEIQGRRIRDNPQCWKRTFNS